MTAKYLDQYGNHLVEKAERGEYLDVKGNLIGSGRARAVYLAAYVAGHLETEQRDAFLKALEPEEGEIAMAKTLEFTVDGRTMTVEKLHEQYFWSEWIPEI